MNRREVIAGLGSAAAWPVLARAQQRPMPTIGFLDTQSRSEFGDRLPAFHRGLGEAGFVEGRNAAVVRGHQFRWR
jgi:putative tryptophan/tyrosine transport system substrate-binding protein